MFPLFFCVIIETAQHVPSTTANRGEWVTVFRGKRKAVFLCFLAKTVEINGKFTFAVRFALVRVWVLCYNFMVFGAEKAGTACFSVKLCKEREIRFDSTERCNKSVPQWLKGR